jgi:hypothetical protein
MPSAAALQRGSEVAAAILAAHRNANSGAWPETVAVRSLPSVRPQCLSAFDTPACMCCVGLCPLASPACLITS